MNFKFRKIENCFAASVSFEYELPIEGKDFIKLIPDWDIRINEKLRRPTAIAQRGDIIIKLTLGGKQYRVSYPEKDWQEQKKSFEKFLESLG